MVMVVNGRVALSKISGTNSEDPFKVVVRSLPESEVTLPRLGSPSLQESIKDLLSSGPKPKS